MRRTALLIGIPALLLLAVVWYVHGQPISIHPPDVVGVLIHPVPEGPTASAPVSEVASAIPDPLPHPAWQFLCSAGATLDIKLSNSRTISYGPCRRPASINHLFAVIVDIATDGHCRPNCGPGGKLGP
jgi:hypothetical protein